ncbi:MAG: hypothetical protein H6923_03380 [Alphaproteobacteria bacterium]|nr:hypothetical protein [Alphaproteobacteria bacterium]
MTARPSEERAVRLLARLAAGALLVAGEGGGCEIRADGAAAGPRLALSPREAEALASRGLVEAAPPPGGALRAWRLSAAGAAFLRRHAGGEEGFRAQHQQLGFRPAGPGAAGGRAHLVNDAESPLAWLARRKGPDGAALLAPEQVAAGERLREDFTRAHLTPRVTTDWSLVPGDRNRRGPPAAIDVRAHALAARERLETALLAVGPGLADILLEVCCFMIGLEDAERRLAWPQRSGKVVLALALERLAVHYGLVAAPKPFGRLRAWQAENARPVI